MHFLTPGSRQHERKPLLWALACTAGFKEIPDVRELRRSATEVALGVEQKRAQES